LTSRKGCRPAKNGEENSLSAGQFWGGAEKRLGKIVTLDSQDGKSPEANRKKQKNAAKAFSIENQVNGSLRGGEVRSEWTLQREREFKK